MATPSRRLHFLDALRGIAALSVVVYHYTLDMRDQGVLGSWGLRFAAVAGDALDLGKFGVVLFFLISGYIIPNSLIPKSLGAGHDRIGRFAISRFFRLYPLYWLAVAVGIFLPWPDLGHPFPPVTILANLTMVQGFLGQPDIVGTAWTLQIELVFYVACAGLAMLHRLGSPRHCAAASLGFLLLALAMAIVRGVLVRKLPVALPLALSLMFFGTLWRQATLDGVAAARRLAGPVLVTILVAIVPISVVAYNHDYGYHEHWQSYVTCYTLGLAVFVLCTTRVKLGWRPFVWLGEISYSLYLLHPLVASAAYHAGFVAAATPLPVAVYLAVLIGLVVLCAWATYTWVEQPFVRLGHAIGRSLRRPGIMADRPR